MSFYVLLEYYALFVLDVVSTSDASPDPEIQSILFYRRLKNILVILHSYVRKNITF